MTEGERQAEIIIKQWIHKVTGTSDLERGMRKIGDAFRQLGEAFGKATDPLQAYIDKHHKEDN